MVERGLLLFTLHVLLPPCLLSLPGQRLPRALQLPGGKHPPAPIVLLPPAVQATIYYDETEEREEGADLEELIRDGQIAFSECCVLPMPSMHRQDSAGDCMCMQGVAYLQHSKGMLELAACTCWLLLCCWPLLPFARNAPVSTKMCVLAPMCICRGAPPCQPRVPQRGDRGAPEGVQGNPRGCKTGLSLAVVRHPVNCCWVDRCCCLATLRKLFGATAKSIAYPTAAGGHQVLWTQAWRGGAGG